MLIILPTTDTNIHITWSLPKAPNGIITAYSLTLLDLKNNNVLYMENIMETTLSQPGLGMIN